MNNNNNKIHPLIKFINYFSVITGNTDTDYFVPPFFTVPTSIIDLFNIAAQHANLLFTFNHRNVMFFFFFAEMREDECNISKVFDDLSLMKTLKT